MRLKELQIIEDATAGATASGNIATVVNPHVANPSRHSVAYTGKPGGPSGEGPVAQYVAKKQKPTDNALDGDDLLMSSKEPQMLRRQIKEGSLYEGWPIVVTNKYLLADGYSGNFYDINSGMINGVLYPALDPSIFEIKYPDSDIKGKVIGDNLGTAGD